MVFIGIVAQFNVIIIIIFRYPGIATEMSVWEGVVVTPSDKAFEKQDEKEEEDDETMETQEWEHKKTDNVVMFCEFTWNRNNW